MTATPQDRFVTAAMQGDLETLQDLWSPGGGIDVNGRACFSDMTAGHWAAYNGHIDCLEFVLKHGASLSLRGAAGETMLSYAVAGNHANIVRLLLDKGAQYDGTIDGKSLEDWAISVGYKNVAAELKKARLVNLGCDLLDAVIDDAVERAEKLLGEGADIEARMPDNREYYNATSVNYAACKGHVAMVEMLIRHGADIHARDCDNDTALDSAVGNAKNLKVIEMLMEAGADPASVNIKGNNARDRARGDQVILELLDRVVPVYGADEVGSQRPCGNRYLEEIFNFAAQERISLMRRHKNGLVESFTREKFSDLDSDTLSNAFNQYREKGGTLDKNRALRSVAMATPVKRIQKGVK